MTSAGTAYREAVAVTQQQTTACLQAEAAAAFADLQVILLRDLAARLRSGGAPAERTLRVEAAADQLEAAARETRHASQPARRPTR
jgi:hypothetical protein